MKKIYEDAVFNFIVQSIVPPTHYLATDDDNESIKIS